MWGTDTTAAFTLEHGQVAVFVAVDHASAECVGIHAALHGTRHEALEPIRQGVAERFGSVEKHAAEGLAIRHDHRSQYVSRDFQREIAWLGARSSPAFIRAPEGNGCAELLQAVNRHRIGTPDRLPKGTLVWARSGTRPGAAVRVAETGRVPVR